MFLDAAFFQLQPNKFSGQTDLSDIKAIDAFQGDHVSLGKDLQGIISEEFFSAAIIEADFYHPAGSFRVAEGEVGQPVVHIESVATTGTTTAVALATIGFAGPTRGTSHVLVRYMLISGATYCGCPTREGAWVDRVKPQTIYTVQGCFPSGNKHGNPFSGKI